MWRVCVLYCMYAARCGVHCCRVNEMYYKSIIISCVVFIYEFPIGYQFLASIRARWHSMPHTHANVHQLFGVSVAAFAAENNLVDIKIHVKLNSVCEWHSLSACSFYFFCYFWHSPITFSKIKIEHIEKIEKDIIISQCWWWWYWTVS